MNAKLEVWNSKMAFYQLQMMMALVVAAAAQFNCPSTEVSGVQTVQLVVPSLQNPNPDSQFQSTCKGFNLPSDTPYHVTAVRPVNNATGPSIPFNMLLFTCTSPVQRFENTVACGNDDIVNANCTNLIGVWATGFAGQCLPDSYGYLIGQQYKYAILQVTWISNSTLPPTTSGSVGLMLYYTANLRPNNGTVLMIRQTNFTIPAQQASYDVQATCSPTCTSQLTQQPIYVTGFTAYMHRLGVSGSLIVQRNGGQQVVVANSTYNPNNPVLVDLATAVQVQPGDALRVTCTFGSRDLSTPTVSGDLPSQEACIGFVTYYQAASNRFSECWQWNTLDFCTTDAFKAPCNLDAFTTLANMLSTVCQPPTCSVLCRSVAQAVVDTNCLKGDMGAYLRLAISSVNDIDPLLAWCGINQLPTLTPTTPLSAFTLKRNAGTANRWQFASLLLVTAAASLPYVIMQ